jgi:hypothetical protein
MMAKRLAISQAEEDEKTKNGQSRVRNQIGWARFYLARAGCLSTPKRGVWKLTEKGQNASLDAESVHALFKDVHAGFDDDEDGPAEPQPVQAQKFKGPRMVFSDHPFTVNDLLTYIDIGDLGLPDIQRPFVWKTTKVRELLDSMFRGYPVGCLLFWGTSATAGGETRKIGTEPRHKAAKLLIVDGQQRLTSLFAVFKGNLFSTRTSEKHGSRSHSGLGMGSSKCPMPRRGATQSSSQTSLSFGPAPTAGPVTRSSATFLSC